VARLHHCGILHTDLKPDNFMLTDLSGYKNFVSAAGSGLVLIDFGRAVDLTVFPGDTLFHGSCNTDGFQCTQMLEGKPWKYEADYFGIAGTVHVLLTGEYMSVQKNPGNGLYHPSKPFSRAQRRGPWSEFFGCLLNTTQPLPLAEMAGEMRTKLKGIQDYVFQAFSKNIFTAVHKKLNQGK
jgi:checkpoint serine/threonine-protein kinase